MIAIDGVGKAKLEKYGDAFVNAIIEFQKKKQSSKAKKKLVPTKKHCFCYKVD
jgi:ATP-dependent DNA helicase RecQ